MPSHPPSTDARASLAQPSQYSSPLECTSHLGFSLVAVRNSMIHSNPTIHLPSTNAYHEAKQLGLWYVELLLLNRFQYMEKYASRLTSVQRPGGTELVPWARSVTN